MSCVEIAKIERLAAASGAASAARTPTVPNSIGPWSFNAAHPFSDLTPSGTASSSQTTDSSSFVRVALQNAPPSAHAGRAASGWRRQTANLPGRRERTRGSVRGGIA